MLHFDTDYMEGAHPEVMRRLMETNLEQTVGYGNDEYTRHARELVREACGQPEAAVYFLVGGTQTNATVIDGLLAHHEKGYWERKRLTSTCTRRELSRLPDIRC